MHPVAIEPDKLADLASASAAVGPMTEEAHAVLLWVRTGSATIEAHGAVHKLDEGDAVWLPPGVEHSARTDPDAVLFPFFIAPTRLTARRYEVRIANIPREWNDWMIHCWDDNSRTRGEPPALDGLLEFFDDDCPRRQGPSAGRTPSPPPLPQSAEALNVARALLRDPGALRTLDGFALQHNVSGKTLQRQFLEDTGLPFSQWRTRARLTVAARHLAEGRSVGVTARSVGFRSPSGFTKAFIRHVGCTPRAYASHTRAVGAGEQEGSSAISGPQGERVEGIRAALPPPLLPPRETWRTINDHHELMWVYRGEAEVTIGTSRWWLRQGHAIWVPTGLPHTAACGQGSLLLTVGRAYGRAGVRAGDLSVFSMPPDSESLLLRTMVGEYTAVRAESGRATFIEAMFRRQFVTGLPDPSGASAAVSEIAVSLHRDPADPRSLADWAAQLRTTPAELGQEFVVSAGESFPRWRARIRMDAAREILQGGRTGEPIHQRLGYSSPAAFSRAFTTAHGLSPRAYALRYCGVGAATRDGDDTAPAMV